MSFDKMPRKRLLRTLYLLSLILITLALSSSRLLASPDVEVPRDLWSIIMKIVGDNLTATLLGFVGAVYYLENRFKLSDKFEQLQEDVRVNRKLMRALIKHFNVHTDLDEEN